MKKMNILYMITTFENGVGGHYYSLISTIEALNKKVNPVIVNIGRKDSPILNATEFKVYDVNYSIWNVFKIQKQIKELIERHDISFIHCFDDRAYFFIRNKIFENIPCALTKCGGKNQRFFPKVDNLILYSQENYDFYSNRKSSLIPNRVLPFRSNHSKISDLKRRLSITDKDLVILRITRFSKYYKRSIIQSINLHQYLIGKGVKSKLILIGTVIDFSFYNEIKKEYKGGGVFILTDVEYTQNAKELIDICDLYIGTGRGFMEASSKGKILLCSVLDFDLPCVVNSSNFEMFFNNNFSERNKINYTEEELKNDILKSINYRSSTQELKKFSLHIFESYFNLESKVSFYENLYNVKEFSSNLNKFDILVQFLFFNYHFYTQGKS